MLVNVTLVSHLQISILDNVNYIRLGTLGNNNSYASDVSAMIEKGDFLAIREISLSYEIPKIS
jgi:hypothetical protein